MSATHYRYVSHSRVTGLDYIVLRLIDNDISNTEYLTFLSSYMSKDIAKDKVVH